MGKNEKNNQLEDFESEAQRFFERNINKKQKGKRRDKRQKSVHLGVMSSSAHLLEMPKSSMYTISSSGGIPMA